MFKYSKDQLLLTNFIMTKKMPLILKLRKKLNNFVWKVFKLNIIIFLAHHNDLEEMFF
jgi:hypothetical protein